MQLFHQHCYIFGFPFHFNRDGIGYIFFYSPSTPLENLLSFGLFMKNYFMLTYICCLFPPQCNLQQIWSISNVLKPVLYVCRSQLSIAPGLKCWCRGPSHGEKVTDRLWGCHVREERMERRGHCMVRRTWIIRGR